LLDDHQIAHVVLAHQLGRLDRAFAGKGHYHFTIANFSDGHGRFSCVE
jgi:hypothetical protein